MWGQAYHLALHVKQIRIETANARKPQALDAKLWEGTYVGTPPDGETQPTSHGYKETQSELNVILMVVGSFVNSFNNIVLINLVLNI